MELTNKMRKEFLDYIGGFYCVDGNEPLAYAKDFFNNKLTMDIASVEFDNFMKIRSKFKTEFCGDSIDRELFRDFLFVRLGKYKWDEVEYCGGWLKSVRTIKKYNNLFV